MYYVVVTIVVIIAALPLIAGFVGNLIAGFEGGMSEMVPTSAFRDAFTEVLPKVWTYFNIVGKLVFVPLYLYAAVTFLIGAAPLTVLVNMPQVFGPMWRFLFVKKVR